MARYMYEVYDTKEQKTLEGLYTAGEVQKLTGSRSDIATYAHDGHLISQRYTVKIAQVGSERPSHKESDLKWASEWDKARLKLLGIKKER